MNLIISLIGDDEDTAGEIQSLIENLGGSYEDEDLPEIYFSIPSALASVGALKGLNMWENQISNVELEDPDSSERKSLISDLRDLWSE